MRSATTVWEADKVEPEDVAVDGNGGIQVVGQFFATPKVGVTQLNSMGEYDVFVLQMDSNGTPGQIQGFGGAETDLGNGIALDSAGGRYICGTFMGSMKVGTTTLQSRGEQDAFVAKVNPTGGFAWAVAGGGPSWDGCNDIAVSAAGDPTIIGNYSNQFVLGTQELAGKLYKDTFIARLTAMGKVSWLTTATAFHGAGIAVDKAGNSYATGYFNVNDGHFGPYTLKTRGGADVYVARLDPHGDFDWAVQGGGALGEVGVAVAVDTAGSTLVTGYFGGVALFSPTTLKGNGVDSDLLLWKLCPEGLCDPCNGNQKCDDKRPCTTDSCTGHGLCEYKLQAGFCKILGTCYSSGDINPKDKCGRCDAASSTTAWANISGCSFCGNGRAELKEKCDGADLGGVKCKGLGFTAGTLKCKASCTHDTGGCTTCGNGIIETGEQCEGSKLNGKSCLSHGFVGGTLKCLSKTCQDDTSGCYRCGNGLLEADYEQCDGAKLGGATCKSLGFPGSGTLACSKVCTLDSSGCTGSPGYHELDVGAHNGAITSSTESPGFYFEAPTDFTITGLRVPLEIGHKAQSVQAVKLAGPLTVGVSTSSFTTMAYHKGITGADFIKVSIPVKKGDAMIIVGGRGAPSLAFSSFGGVNSYTTKVDGKPMVLSKGRVLSNISSAQGGSVRRISGGELYRVELRYTVP